jgi:tryptophanyl-tRNA synthetase
LTTTTTKSKRVLSGMRPTGRLHIGHYFGALQNWVKLQNDSTNECFYFIADWHALTSDYADASAIAENSIQITIDYLASGLEASRSTIFLQSFVPEHAELHLLLSMLTPLGELERIPTYKEAIENIRDKDLHTYGFLGYPTLQTADIVIYSDPGKPLFVPVGEDQVSHVEFSRQLVSRFNFFYGLKLDYRIFDPKNEIHLRNLYDQVSDALIHTESRNGRSFVDHFASLLNRVAFDSAARRLAQKAGIRNFLDDLGPCAEFFSFVPVLTEPDVLLTPTPRIPGLDGRKMSKSYGNAITLSESDADIRSKTKVMVTDPARKRRTDAGNPDVCPVYDWHKLFSPRETLDWAAEGCRTAGIGCIECKSKMADHLIQWIEPVRSRRVEYEQHPKRVMEILDAGSARARESAQQTMQRVRESIFNWNRKRQEIADASP